MDSEKKWGCIGYALLALITWGLTQGFKVVCIIIGILMAHLQSSVFKLSKDLIDSIHEEGIVAYTS